MPALTAAEWEAAHAKMLDNPSLKKGVKPCRNCSSELCIAKNAKNARSAKNAKF